MHVVMHYIQTVGSLYIALRHGLAHLHGSVWGQQKTSILARNFHLVYMNTFACSETILQLSDPELLNCGYKVTFHLSNVILRSVWPRNIYAAGGKSVGISQIINVHEIEYNKFKSNKHTSINYLIKLCLVLHIFV